MPWNFQNFLEIVYEETARELAIQAYISNEQQQQQQKQKAEEELNGEMEEEDEEDREREEVVDGWLILNIITAINNGHAKSGWGHEGYKKTHLKSYGH